MRDLLRVFLFCAFASQLALVGCKNKASSTDDSSTSGTAAPPVATAPTVTAAAPLAIKLYTKYDGTEYINQLIFAETGTDTCSSSDGTPVVTCTVSVPEGRLYFSGLTIQYSWLSTKCKLMHFQPYYYQGALLTNAAYLPPGATSSVDCSANPTPASCWGGAAPLIVPGFPQFRLIIFPPDETTPAAPLTGFKTVNSAFSANASTNRVTVNDQPAAKYAISYAPGTIDAAASPVPVYSATDGYVGSTMVNYQFFCRDDWYDPVTYIINLKVREVNSDAGNPVRNDFGTWPQ